MRLSGLESFGGFDSLGMESSAPANILDTVDWYVVAARTGSEASIAMEDLSGGGRHVYYPGGTNDPVYLEYSGSAYIWFSGESDNNLTVPNNSVFDFLSTTGTVDFRWHGRLDDYTPATIQPLICRADGGLCFIFRVNTDGTLLFLGGGANNSSTVATGWTDGEDAWFRAVADKDNDELIFYTSTDGVIWSQLGDVLSVAIGPFNNTASPVYVGQYSTNYGSSHRFYRGIIIESGTTVLDINANDADPNSNTFNEASSNNALVTINRSTSGYVTEVVKQPMYAFAIDDYLFANDSPLFNIGTTDDFTAMVVFRSYHTPTTQHMFGKKQSLTTPQGWVIYPATSGVFVTRVEDIDGTDTFDISSGLQINVTSTIALRLDRSEVTIRSFLNGIADDSPGNIATVDDCTNTEQLRIGGTTAGGYVGMSFIGALTVKRSLSSSEQLECIAALITANGGTP